ncbi:type IV toxin-antitoxin system AbiEi family antitoxin [Asinibacterium sp. OR53]|uniref:type IV toxin-antitoxin system AbiEi family antitoxin n=1 Tax=Asinibacterium sp. OR53 TaxID=925409 RepID=UPI00047DABAF|nr:type IV toxin-antitoxin system AbiEi family antitoxin [Asinibacterium sp. OR53]
MNTEDIVIEALDNLFTQTGFQGKFKPTIYREDGEIDFDFRNKHMRVFAEIKKEIKPYQLPDIEARAKKYEPYMIVADRIYPATKEQLRKKGIGYLDTAGNIYLDHDNIMIWQEGNKQKEDKKKAVTNRAFTKTGLKAVFYLMLNEHALNQPYRQTAEITGIALGNIKYIIDGLKEAGYILRMDDRKCLLQNKKALLERWIAGYREILKPALLIGNFRFTNNDTAHNLFGPAFINDEITVGGEPAAERITKYLHPEIYTLYTTLVKTDMLRRFKFIPDAKGNIEIYRKFWNEKFIAEDNLNTAPLILVYADLVITDDPRCIETAQIIYDKYLRDEFERR